MNVIFVDSDEKKISWALLNWPHDDIFICRNIYSFLESIKKREVWHVLSLGNELGLGLTLEAEGMKLFNSGISISNYLSKIKPIINQIIIHENSLPVAETMEKVLLFSGYTVYKIPFNPENKIGWDSKKG